MITAIYSASKHSDIIFEIIALVAGEYALGLTTAVFHAAIASARGSTVKRNG